MLEKLNEAINEVIHYSGHIFLKFTSFNLCGDDIELTISMYLLDNEQLIQQWKITGVEVQEYKIESIDFEEFEVLDDHYYLWDYHKKYTELFFRGETKNIKELISDLYLKHYKLTEGFIPFEKYLNKCDLDLLLKGKLGILSNGPAELNEAYREILSNYGFNTSLIDISQPINKCKVLLCDKSFVVAEEFIAQRIN